MPIEVTVRHKGVADDDQEYAKQKAEAILEEFARIKVEHVHVILNVEKHLSIAEVTAQARNHIRVEAEESGNSMRVCIDAAVDKVSRQLRRRLEKVQDHRAAKKHSEAERTGEVEQ
ncbi:HPF/RaiA family ribosome-associated protein [Verrucomicrobiota bacterium]